MAEANTRPVDPRRAAKHGEKVKEIQRKQLENAREQQRDQARFNVQVRQMQALESIAEALHVAYEDKIDAFRKRLADIEAEEAAAAKAKAEADALLTPEAPTPIPAQA